MNIAVIHDLPDNKTGGIHIMKLQTIIYLLILVFGMQLGLAHGETEEESGTLVVIVHGFRSDEGAARAAIYSSKKSFLDISLAFQKAELEISGGKSKWVIKDVPYGEYALAVYHDKNNNSKLDEDYMRLPEEDTGYSNNAQGIFKPPKFRKAKLRMDSKFKEIEITVRDRSYLK